MSLISSAGLFNASERGEEEIARNSAGGGWAWRSPKPCSTCTPALSPRRATGGTRFDLLISDLGRPDASGHELIEPLRARYGRDVKATALGGCGMEDDLKRSREAGFGNRVVKPVNVAQLQTVIRQLLDAGGE